MNNTKIINNKLGLLKLAEELSNVSQACKLMGYSRDTFYRYKELVKEGGMSNLIDKSRRKGNTKNRIDFFGFLRRIYSQRYFNFL